MRGGASETWAARAPWLLLSTSMLTNSPYPLRLSLHDQEKWTRGRKRQEDGDDDEDTSRLDEYCTHHALQVTSTRTNTLATYDYGVDVDVDRHGQQFPQPPMNQKPEFADDCMTRCNGDRKGHGYLPLLLILCQLQSLPLKRSMMFLITPLLPLS